MIKQNEKNDYNPKFKPIKEIWLELVVRE